MKSGRMTAAALSLLMLGGICAPAQGAAFTARAAGGCYAFDADTGALTLLGEVVPDEITGFEQKDEVLSVTAAEGTVLPHSCDTLFENYSHCTAIDLSRAESGSTQSMRYMFQNCSALTSLDLSGLDTSKVTDMSGMFSGCSSLTALDLHSLDTGSVGDMQYMFYKCSALTSLELHSFNTSAVTNMQYMFGDCAGLETLDLTGFDTFQVTTMRAMFLHCDHLRSVSLDSFDTSNVKTMLYMFDGCHALESLDLSGFYTYKLTDTAYMFSYCESLTQLDLSGFYTPNLTSSYRMFYDCPSLERLDLSGLDLTNVWLPDEMFMGCPALRELTVGSGFGEIGEVCCLVNDNDWYSISDTDTPVSGSGEYARIPDSGGDTYIRITGRMRIRGEDAVAAPGEMVAYSVYVDRNPGYDTLSLVMNYDTSLDVRKESGMPGGAYTISGPAALTGSNICSFNAAKGWISFADTGRENHNSDKLFTVFFTVPEEMEDGVCTFTFDNCRASLAGESVPLTQRAGTLTVRSYVKGDVNYDGAITVADIVLLQKWVAAVPDTHLPHWRNADLNDDDRIDILDLCLLRQMLLTQDDPA